MGLFLRKPETPECQQNSSSKTLYTYRVQLLPHEHFEVVLFMQQIKYVRHLIVPSDASEETHLQRERAACISIAWSSLSQTTSSRVWLRSNTRLQQQAGLTARLHSFPPLPVFLPPDPLFSTGAFPGEFRNATHWLSPPLLSKHDYHVLKAILLGRHPSVPTLLITAPSGLLSHVGQFQAYRIGSGAGSLSGQLLSVHTQEAGLNLVLQGK